jgi:hypothetical protein
VHFDDVHWLVYFSTRWPTVPPEVRRPICLVDSQ